MKPLDPGLSGMSERYTVAPMISLWPKPAAMYSTPKRFWNISTKAGIGGFMMTVRSGLS